MHTAQITFRKDLNKFMLVLGDKVIAKANNARYLQRVVDKQWGSAKKHGVTKWVMADKAETVQVGTATPVVKPSVVDINQRFEFMGDLLDMVISKTAKSVIISGPGGLGKSFEVIKALKRNNLTDARSIQPSIEDLEIEDDEAELEAKIEAAVSAPRGDYTVVKGHSSAASLYRILFENKDRIVVFDDCDGVLKDGTALNLLKAALDSYDERWISWWSERSFGDSDLPRSFKFTGSVIFVTNVAVEKLDEALLTRAFKVDLAMTKQERLDRMAAVLEDIMPTVDLEPKREALEFLSEHRDMTDDINFRTLMNLVTVRVGSKRDWKALARFALLQGN